MSRSSGAGCSAQLVQKGEIVRVQLVRAQEQVSIQTYPLVETRRSGTQVVATALLLIGGGSVASVKASESRFCTSQVVGDRPFRKVR